MNQTIHNLSIPLHLARRHGTHSMSNVSLVVLSPMEPLFGEQNKDSIVVKLTYPNVSFKLMGVADSDTKHRLLPLPSIWPQTDVLKLGHHGSRYSSAGEWLDAVQPSLGGVCGPRDRTEILPLSI